MARISSGVSHGNTDAKHRINRFSCSDMDRPLDAMEQHRNAGRKLLSRKSDRGHGRAPEQLREELLERTISRRGFVVEFDFVNPKSLEQILHTLMFDAAGKRPATHHPGIHLEFTAKGPSQNDRDLSQRPIS